MTYAVVLIVLAIGVLEVARPRVPSTDMTRRRWLGNLLLYASTIAAWSLPFVAALAAGAGGERGLIGLAGMPDWLGFVLGVLLLDVWGYASHRVSHLVPPLWRLHAVHHSDPELDVTTTLRQHPGAMLIESAATACVVVAFGVPAAAFAAYRLAEALVQTLAHANITGPAWVSRLIVTPSFHRLHHSPEMAETNSNYGQVLAVWDHLFGTARAASSRPERFGLDVFDMPHHQDLHWLLAQPVLRRTPAAPAMASSVRSAPFSP